MKAIETIKNSNGGESDKYEILNFFAVDLINSKLKELKTES